MIYHQGYTPIFHQKLHFLHVLDSYMTANSLDLVLIVYNPIICLGVLFDHSGSIHMTNFDSYCKFINFATLKGKNGPKIRQPRKLLLTHNILHWRECKEKQLLDKWRLMTCLGKKYPLWHIVEVLPYTISWHYLTIFDYIRQLLSRFDILGHYSTLFNFIRSNLTTFDIIRTHLISFDSFQLFF